MLASVETTGNYHTCRFRNMFSFFTA